MASPLIHENIWFEKPKYEAAERQYYEKLSKVIEEALKTVELSIELKNFLKTKDLSEKETKLSNAGNDSGNEVISSTALSVKDEKRSKKEKKNKKEKKEKETKKEQKISNGSLKSEGVENCANNSIGYNAENKGKASSNPPMKQSLASEVAKARQHIKQSLECMDGIAAMAGSNVELVSRINSLEKENATLHKVVDDLKNLVISLDGRVKSLEGGKPSAVPAAAKIPAKTPAKAKDDDDDDGVDLFGSDSDEESEEAAKIREQRLAAYAAKKSNKPALIAKSNIILSVSPWDDETDMKKMEECVRTIEMDGLIWGASQLVPLAYGIHKLHISCVVEDDKVSVDLLQEKIQEFEDYVQSADIAAFNKV
ncbi:elongation factor 1-delta isoform X2 [Frankliniella occidentalis]|uniref:Elongation factor 1-delta isoform X2 n=1 Tax=Frankliniella occidentalis TaxID=133901 RepID=A0A6J1TL60_FRAOC|nr:elongation factor 1-delta isoform X2 [Frankliniella occidentalis]